jgi:hypothetical protein
MVRTFQTGVVEAQLFVCDLLKKQKARWKGLELHSC